MKRIFLIAMATSVSMFSFAQKKELKAAEKALKAGKAAEAKATLTSIASLAEANAKYKDQYFYLKGQAANNLAEYDDAIAALKQVGGKKAGDAETLLAQIAGNLVNAAIEDNKVKNYADAAQKLYQAYEIDKNNQDYLYYAASSAVNGGEYDTALAHYIELKDIGYTGISKQYFVTEAATGQEREVSETEYGLYQRSKDYTNPRVAESDSRLPEIVKNIALIYSQKGEVDKAVEAAKEARAANPDDIGLLLTEANLYIKLDRKDKFKELMEEAVAKQPTNPDLYYNLGVINAEQGDVAKAREYYEKAISLKPDHENSYLNLSALMLSEDEAIVTEMNGLGTSRADNARYDELKQKREDIFRSAVPYLEKLLEVNPKSADAVRTLMNIYGTIGDTAKFKEMKAKLTELGG